MRLPGTGLDVSRLCLGGNRFGGALDQAASFALLDAFVEAGGNFVDTAHVYADWLPDVERSCSEKTIGRWLRARRPAGLVIATKGGHPRLDAPGRSRLDEASLRQDVSESLSFLGLERLDLFYLHRDDPQRPVGETLDVLETLRREGLMAHYGASNWSTARLRAARDVASRGGWAGFVANQPEWNLARRNPGAVADDLLAMDAEMLAFHQDTGLAAIPYSAQAKGYFDKAISGALDAATARLYDNPRNRELAERVTTVAAAHGATPTQVMLSALMRAPFPVVPVVGCRTPDQIASSFAAAKLDLDPAEVDLLPPAPSLEAAEGPS
jgi:aryl-alcohol dehydrogenase-like predicted oxidoreductase